MLIVGGILFCVIHWNQILFHVAADPTLSKGAGFFSMLCSARQNRRSPQAGDLNPENFSTQRCKGTVGLETNTLMSTMSCTLSYVTGLF